MGATRFQRHLGERRPRRLCVAREHPVARPGGPSGTGGPPCYDNAEYTATGTASGWQQVQVSWDMFQRQGWGGYPTLMLDPTRLYTLSFRPGPDMHGPGQPFELRVDRIELM